MTQRNKYRTGRRFPRQRERHKQAAQVVDETLSNSVQQGADDMKENEPLIQVETRTDTTKWSSASERNDSSVTSDVAKVALEGFVATATQENTQSKKDDVMEIKNKEDKPMQEALSQSQEKVVDTLSNQKEDVPPLSKTMSPATDNHGSPAATPKTEPASTSTESKVDEGKAEDENSPDSASAETEDTDKTAVKKGSVGKSVATIVALAAIIGGGYYYAKQQGLIGDQAPAVTETTTDKADPSAEPSLTSNTSSGDTASASEPTASSEASTNSSSEPSSSTTEAQGTTTEGTGAASQETTPSQNSTEGISSAGAPNSATTETSNSATTETSNPAETKVSESVSAQTETTATEASSGTEEGVSETATATDAVSTTAHTEGGADAPQDATVASLYATVQQQKQQIQQLVEQLKATQTAMADQQAKAEQQQALRETLHNLTRLYQSADFERTVRVSKENTLKALSVLDSTLALQHGEAWSNAKLAVEQDIETLKAATDVDLDKLFKATKELEELLKVAPFVSAESGQGVITPVETVAATEAEANAEATTTSWLDKAINQVEKLPGQAYEAIRSDLGGLIKVEKLSNPDVAMMSVEQVKQQRAETLRQLSIAQEALLKRQQTIWAEAIHNVEQSLTTYYNHNVDVVQQALALAHQLANTSVATQLPDLNRTQQALEQLARQLRLDN